MSVVDWTNLYTRHKGQWVALKDDEKTVIASGKNARQVLEESKKSGHPNPIMTKVPKENLSYIGAS